MVFDVVKYRRRNRRWQKKYDSTAPKAGDMATDFELSDAAGDITVSLSAYYGKKPVALIFGSFT